MINNGRRKRFMYLWKMQEVFYYFGRKEKTEYERERNDLYEVFGKEIELKDKEIERLNTKVATLEAENMALKSRTDTKRGVPLLVYGKEKDFYPREIKEILVSILEDCRNNLAPSSRRYDVINDIIAANEAEGTQKMRAEEIKTILKGYTKMDSALKGKLEDFGFTISADRKHYKLLYFDDPRYLSVMSKTASDNRSGMNLATNIVANML